MYSKEFLLVYCLKSLYSLCSCFIVSSKLVGCMWMESNWKKGSLAIWCYLIYCHRLLFPMLHTSFSAPSGSSFSNPGSVRSRAWCINRLREGQPLVPSQRCQETWKPALLSGKGFAHLVTDGISLKWIAIRMKQRCMWKSFFFKNERVLTYLLSAADQTAL